MSLVTLCALMFLGGIIAGFIAVGPEALVYLWRRIRTGRWG